MTALVLDLACVQRLAQVVLDDYDKQDQMYDAATVALGYDFAGDRWVDLLDQLQTRADVEDRIALQFRAAQVSLADRDVAWALYRLTNDDHPCSRCLDSLSGEPYEVAAKAQSRGQCTQHREQVAS